MVDRSQVFTQTTEAADRASIFIENGWFPERRRVKVTARVTVTSGYLYQFDLTGSDAAVTAGEWPGLLATSPFANIIAPTTVANKTAHVGISCIALEDIADDATGYVLMRGVHDTAFCESTVVAGHGLSAESNGKLKQSTTTSRKLVGIALTDYDGVTETCAVFFDGINGVGSVR